ncbi:MAG: FAD:protein FMN transferase, partial [Candidatus Gracilibacteria bacterium]
ARNFEEKFSRFKNASELNKLNKSNGGKIKVSAEMIDLLIKAKGAYIATNGLFDPTILVSLNSVGYNKSFNTLKDSQQKSAFSIKKKFKERIKFDALKINKKQKTVNSPAGLNIDFGGIAKGYWVDKTQKILDNFFDNFWISAGGDVYIKGKNEDASPWGIGVQNPTDLNSDILKLNLPPRGFGIATSGITKRRGIKNKISWHHIIDTRTGMPVKNSILSATVIANSTTNADVMAKTILILGVKKGLALINGMRDHECVIIDKDLKINVSKGIKKFLGNQQKKNQEY